MLRTAIIDGGLHGTLRGEALQRVCDPHRIGLRVRESQRGRRSVGDTLTLATLAIPAILAIGARKLLPKVLLLRAKGDATRADGTGVADAPAPLGVCATGSGVPQLMLVAIVLLREDGLESIRAPEQTSKHWTRLKIFGRPGTKFGYPREPPINFHICPTSGTVRDGAQNRDTDRFKKTTKISFVFL